MRQHIHVAFPRNGERVTGAEAPSCGGMTGVARGLAEVDPGPGTVLVVDHPPVMGAVSLGVNVGAGLPIDGLAIVSLADLGRRPDLLTAEAAAATHQTASLPVAHLSTGRSGSPECSPVGPLTNSIHPDITRAEAITGR